EDVKEVEESMEYKPVFLTTNASSLRGKIHVVIRFQGQHEQIPDNQDVILARGHLGREEIDLQLLDEALEPLWRPDLTYAGSNYPLASIVKTKKYIERGWTVNAGQYLKMALQLNEMNLHDPKVLEEQLTGVDFAYFQMIIQDIKEKQEEDKNFKIDNNYLM